MQVPPSYSEVGDGVRINYLDKSNVRKPHKSPSRRRDLGDGAEGAASVFIRGAREGQHKYRKRDSNELSISTYLSVIARVRI